MAVDRHRRGGPGAGPWPGQAVRPDPCRGCRRWPRAPARPMRASSSSQERRARLTGERGAGARRHGASAAGLKPVGVFRDRRSRGRSQDCGQTWLDGGPAARQRGCRRRPRARLPRASKSGRCAASDGGRSRRPAPTAACSTRSQWRRAAAPGEPSTGRCSKGATTCRPPSSPAASARPTPAPASRVGAYGLDVGSSVEARPGVKDPAKVEALFAALRPRCRGAHA